MVAQWWCSVPAMQKERWFESCPGRHVGTLSKFLVHNYNYIRAALLSLACIRKKGDIKDQLYCIVLSAD